MNEHNLQSGKEKGLGRMVLISALLHIFVISGVVASIAWQGPRASVPISYRVELVDPAALGRTFSVDSLKTPTPPPQKPGVKPTPPPKKEAIKKEEPSKVKLSEKPVKADKPQKKKDPKKTGAEKAKLSKPEETKAKPMPKTSKAMPPPKPAEKTPESPSTPAAEELDKQYLAAIDRIRRQLGGSEAPTLRPGSEQDSAGVGGGGSSGGVIRGFEFLVYYNELQKQIKESWIVTERKEGLSAVVRFGVQANGEVFDIELIRSSGDRAFDQSVLRAVNKVNPLPPPPSAYQQEFARQKVEITFGAAEQAN